MLRFVALLCCFDLTHGDKSAALQDDAVSAIQMGLTTGSDETSRRDPPHNSNVQTSMDTALAEVKKVQPSDVADLNKKEGMLYDLTEKIAEMCTITEEDDASDAKTKEQICAYIPKIALGYYYGDEVNNETADHADDMSAIGCTDLPLVGDERYFIFGIELPEVKALKFGGGNLCYAQWMNGDSVGSGTGMILFAPQLFTSNPVVRNINVPVPGTGEAVDSAAGLISYVAVGVSFSGGDPKMEVELSTDFWKCSGECKTIKANVYAAVKMDVTEALTKKINLGDEPTLSLAFEAKVMFNFDPDGDDYNVPLVNKLINGDGEKSGSQSLVDPTRVMDFLVDVMSNDFILAIDGKLTMTIPLKAWSDGLFEDLDLTIGTASAMFRNANVCEEVGISTGDFNHGDVIALKQKEHNTYLSLCNSKAYGDSSKKSRTLWIVEKDEGYVYLKSKDTNTYLGLMNNDNTCGDSKHGAYGFTTKQSRTKWLVEEISGYFHLRQPDHGTYIGMGCSASGCDATHNAYGCPRSDNRTAFTLEKEPLRDGDVISFKQKEHGTYLGLCEGKAYSYSSLKGRTQWVVETDGSYIYLKSKDENKYLGLSGNDLTCGDSKHGALGYTSKQSRTKWLVEETGGYFHLKQPEHGTYIGMSGGDSGCDSSKHGVRGHPRSDHRTAFTVVKQECQRQTGIWASFALGGHKDDDILDDIQQKIMDLFQSTNVLSAVGFLGKEIGAMVNAFLSIGVGFDLYMKGNCNFHDWNSACSNTAFGLKVWFGDSSSKDDFEAYIEKNPDGRFAFCFAIKRVWDSCGNNLWENILLLLKAAGEILMKVGKIIAEFAAETFNTAVKAVVDLAGDALQAGKIVIDKVHEGFEDAANEVVDWAGNAGGDAVEWADDAVNDAGEFILDVGGATVDFANDAVKLAEGLFR